jgi:hypothetical protein
VVETHPDALFIAGQVVFRPESFSHRILHNEVAFALQRRLVFRGFDMIILPVELPRESGEGQGSLAAPSALRCRHSSTPAPPNMHSAGTNNTSAACTKVRYACRGLVPAYAVACPHIEHCASTCEVIATSTRLVKS